MHILLLTQYYHPEIGAPQNRLSALALGLKQAGHRVTVLTAMPNYPTGKVHTGYGGLLRRELWNDIRLIRTPIYPTQSAGFVKRLACYFSFVFSSALIGGWFVNQPDYILTESPPLFLGLSGFFLSRWKGARWIFNVSDLWPESAVRLGLLKTGLALRLSESLEAFCYRRSWLVTGQSLGIVSSIRERFREVQTYYLPNGADTQQFRPDCSTSDARAMLGGEDGCVVLYAGLHGLAQGLDQIVEAAACLKDDRRIRFVMVGEGPAKRSVMNAASERGLANIRFLDPVVHREMPKIVAAADIVIVPLAADIPGAVPSKLYEAMASGRPLVVVASGEPAEIISKHDAGIVVSPGNIAGLVDGVRALANDPSRRLKLGRRARCAAVEKYDRVEIGKRFVAYLEEHL